MNGSMIPITNNPAAAFLPLQLRANDIQKHILSIDSRFRDNPTASESSNFYYRFQSPIKNILRMRITSIEFPNNYYFFSAKRNNTTFRVLYKDTPTSEAKIAVITIGDGNYTAYEMESEINNIFLDPAINIVWLTVKFEPISGHFIFTGSKYFAIDTLYNAYERPFDYGLGYYLGFTSKCHKGKAKGAACYEVESDQLANFSGDSYLFLKINDYNCVSHSMYTNELTATAKILVRELKNYMAFDDYAGQHAKEVVFPTPQDFSRLKIQIVDTYGQLVDMAGMNMSFSIEILEIKNLSLYNMVRESLAIKYSGIPSGFDMSEAPVSKYLNAG